MIVKKVNQKKKQKMILKKIKDLVVLEYEIVICRKLYILYILFKKYNIS